MKLSGSSASIVPPPTRSFRADHRSVMRTVVEWKLTGSTDLRGMKATPMATGGEFLDSPSRFRASWIWRRWHSDVAGAIAMLMIGAISGLAAEPDVSAILARVQLLPVKDEAGLLLLDSWAEGSPSAKASPEERAEAARASVRREACAARFSKWVRHDDEFLFVPRSRRPAGSIGDQDAERPHSRCGRSVRSNGIGLSLLSSDVPRRNVCLAPARPPEQLRRQHLLLRPGGVREVRSTPRRIVSVLPAG